MNRRNFLRHLSFSPLAVTNVTASISLFSMVRQAYADTNKTLVVIFQRGGCDGINTIIPYGDDEYYNLRPDISIAAPGNGSKSTIDIDGFFGFHPSLSAFQDLYQQGNMAIFPATHYPNGNRSHFSSQDFIESGVTKKTLSDGWLNRYLTLSNNNSFFRAVSFGGLSHSLRGSGKVSTINNLENIEKFPNTNENFRNQLSKVIHQPIDKVMHNRSLLHKEGSVMLDNLEILPSLNYSSYTPENGVTYPDSSYGQQLRQIAYLIKSDLQPEVISLNHNGWDHHAKQGGTEGIQATKLSDFSQGISALCNDLGTSKLNDVVILTMTEFGRTAKQNASGGTDHGNASCWFAIGGSVSGGIFGNWPGLQKENLYLGRYLQQTIDYRDILTEILLVHLNSSKINTILPNHNYQSIGFL